MTTSDHQHGTSATYHRGGCRCHECRAAALRYEKRRRLDAAQGKVRTIPALGTQRRVQSLLRIGWTAGEIAAACGWAYPQSVQLLLTRDRVRSATADLIDATWQRLQVTPGRSAMGARRAERKGWPPPLAWLNIDDPAEVPDPGYREPSRAVLLSDLAEQGCTLTAATEALGITASGLWKWCDRHDQKALWWALAAREDRRGNQYQEGAA